MGGETPQSALGLQDHQTCPDRWNSVLVGKRNINDYPGRCQHADTSNERSGQQSDRLPTPLDVGSLREKTTCSNSYVTNQ